MSTDNQEWHYRGKKVTPESIPSWAVGYIYCITNTQAIDEECGHTYNKPYIGKKALNSTTRSKIGVREKAATKTRKTYKKTTKSSNWKDYWSSCEELKADKELLGEQAFERVIIEWCYSKKNMTYCEIKHQILNQVLENDSYNKNIQGSLFRVDCDRELWEAHKEKMKNTPRQPRKKKQPL